MRLCVENVRFYLFIIKKTGGKFNYFNTPPLPRVKCTPARKSAPKAVLRTFPLFEEVGFSRWKIEKCQKIKANIIKISTGFISRATGRRYALSDLLTQTGYANGVSGTE